MQLAGGRRLVSSFRVKESRFAVRRQRSEGRQGLESLLAEASHFNRFGNAHRNLPLCCEPNAPHPPVLRGLTSFHYSRTFASFGWLTVCNGLQPSAVWRVNAGCWWLRQLAPNSMRHAGFLIFNRARSPTPLGYGPRLGPKNGAM